MGDIEPTWYSRRDILLEQLSDLLSELQKNDDGSPNTDELLDHLDGTRRALDRFAAILSDKYSHPTNLECFSPSVSRPVSTATIASSNDSSIITTADSINSLPSYQSSPTTLLSDPGLEDRHRRSLLEEDDEDDVLLGRHQLTAEDDEDEEDGKQEDADERFERLSMLLTSVLKEAHAAISIPAGPLTPGFVDEDVRRIGIIAEEEEPVAFAAVEDDITPTPSALGAPFEAKNESTATATTPFLPVSPGLIVSICNLSDALTVDGPPSTAVTPFSSLNSRLRPRAPRPSISDLFAPEVSTSRSATPLPSKNNKDISDIEEEEQEKAETVEVVQVNTSNGSISLDSILGDYLNEMLTDMRQSDIIGVRFWMIVGIVTAMWCFLWITQGWGCSCDSRVAV